MDLASLPLWAQQLSAILLTLGTAMALRWAEKRKAEKPVEAGNGDTQVVAASFIEKRLMERLIEHISALNANLILNNSHLEKINERMHEDELVRAAVARMKEGKP